MRSIEPVIFSSGEGRFPAEGLEVDYNRFGFNPLVYLGFLIGIPTRWIDYVIKIGADNFYTEVRIPKKGGGVRVLQVPLDPLMGIQRRILRKVLSQLEPKSSCHGFVTGRSIITNAQVHVGSTHMLVLDLESAFDQGLSSRIFRELWGERVGERRLGFLVASLITQLCTVYSGDIGERYGFRHLPQGAPTSPALFNLACRPLDGRLDHFVWRIGGVYTRYADNLAFSVPRQLTPKEEHIIRKIVDGSGFRVNDAKTRLMRQSGHSILRLPGVAINNGRIILPKRKRKQLRAAIYLAALHGETDRLRGLIGFVEQVYGPEVPRQIIGSH
ncbi:MAG: hypothetical protein A2172_00935 [Candidatus Woykebacteria bacterium RBG_13_40_15]|uniref:RNA-directed DNA polymerase n=1 Tax=Candidatus Woykebacteria bacterium RBG_13_40_15 TaxID=1802593 RepID=A0A1G1W8T9_9BACT|nr:MAG: hypothetical protein A2172_00935 [Candidatus Woykebacteria bacterium RBG_13_40_15]